MFIGQDAFNPITNTRGKNCPIPPHGGKGKIEVTNDYNFLENKPIHVNTKEVWDSQLYLIGQAGHIYVYSDWQEIAGVLTPAIKIGDGSSYLIDLPVLEGNSASSQVTPSEKDFWNNKVTCYIPDPDSEMLIFSKS